MDNESNRSLWIKHFQNNALKKVFGPEINKKSQ